MAFQDELRDLAYQYLPEDKRAEWDEKVKPIFEKIGAVVTEKNKDLDTWKAKARELETKILTNDPGAGAAAGTLEAWKKALSDKQTETDELRKSLESRNAEYNDLALQLTKRSKEANDNKKLFDEVAAKLQAEADRHSGTIKEAALRKALGELDWKRSGAADEVYAMLESRIGVSVGEDGSRKVFAKMKTAEGAEVEAPVEDFIQSWATTSPLAPDLLSAPRTSGSGASGSNRGGGRAEGLEAQYEAAMSRKDIATALALKTRLSSTLK